MKTAQQRHNESVAAHARVEAALSRMTPEMQERTLARMAAIIGCAGGVEFRCNEREHDEGIKLHPLERRRAHIETAARLGIR